jgi:hypothetical protein
MMNLVSLKKNYNTNKEIIFEDINYLKQVLDTLIEQNTIKKINFRSN